MAARQIIDLPGEFHFLTFSTYQRRRFLDSAETRDIVMEVLQQMLISRQANCAGFVVMPDHVHAIIFGGENFRITPFVQVWKKTSSYRIKQFFLRELARYRELCPEDCPIWQARFYDSTLGTNDDLNAKIEYMHINPVEARLAENALLWSWSSARFHELNEAVGVTITPVY